MIRDVKIDDAEDIKDIYNYYIVNSAISFEEVEHTTSDSKKKIEQIKSKYPFIVFEENSRVIGYAYATPWRTRDSYRFTLETSIYINNNKTGNKIGLKLYMELLSRLKEKGYQVAIGSITVPNEASFNLHKKLGFIQVGTFHKVGYKNNQWHDVSFWELDLNLYNK